jgi:hypothetical protein
MLKELDYTVCSIHSRFGLGRVAQTERILRAMDNRYFNILDRATGRLLLKHPGYDIYIDRVTAQARQNGCFFKINSSQTALTCRLITLARLPPQACSSPSRPIPQHGRARPHPLRHRSGAACQPGTMRHLKLLALEETAAASPALE